MSEPPAVAAFHRITAWLREHAPSIENRLNGPAPDDDLETLERQLAAADPPFGHPVPEDLRAILKTHDGGREAGIMPGGPDFDECPFELLSAGGVFEEWRRWVAAEAESPMDEDDLAYAADESDPEVRRVGYDPAWLPFAEIGGNVLCLDLHPADGGTPGQVISHNHETAGNRVLAPSLTAYLEAAAEKFEAGAFAFESDGGYLVRT